MLTVINGEYSDELLNRAYFVPTDKKRKQTNWEINEGRCSSDAFAVISAGFPVHQHEILFQWRFQFQSSGRLLNSYQRFWTASLYDLQSLLGLLRARRTEISPERSITIYETMGYFEKILFIGSGDIHSSVVTALSTKELPTNAEMVDSPVPRVPAQKLSSGLSSSLNVGRKLFRLCLFRLKKKFPRRASRPVHSSQVHSAQTRIS